MRKYTFGMLIATGLSVAMLGAVMGYRFITRTQPETAAETQDEAVVNISEEALPEYEAASEILSERTNVAPPPDLTLEAGSDPETAAAPEDTWPAGHRYVLSHFNGYVAVFSASDEDPDSDYLRYSEVMEVTGTPVTALSPDERRRLTVGIKISDDEQLAKILQDYGS